MIWILYILIEAVVQRYFIEEKKSRPVYWQITTVRIIAAILYGAFFMEITTNAWVFIGWILALALPFPFLFNTLLNTFRKLEDGTLRPLDYVGKTSGLIDPLIYRYNLQRPYYWFTFILFCIAFRWLLPIEDFWYKIF